MADQSALGTRMRCWCYNCARVVSSVVSPSSPAAMTCPVCGDGFVESINGSMLRSSSRPSRLLNPGPSGSQGGVAGPEDRMVPSNVLSSSQEGEDEEEEEEEEEGEEQAAHEDDEDRGPSVQQQHAMLSRLLLHEARQEVERRARSNGVSRSEELASAQSAEGTRAEEASAVLSGAPGSAGGEGSAVLAAASGARDAFQPLHVLLDPSVSSEGGSSELLPTVESQLQGLGSSELLSTVESQLQELESLLAEVRQDMGVLHGIAASTGRISQQQQPGESSLLQAQADEAPEAPEPEPEGGNEEEQEASDAWGVDQSAWTEFLRLRRQMRQGSPGWLVARNRWLIRQALGDYVAPGFDVDGDYVHTPAEYQAVLDRLQREAEEAGRTAGGAGGLPACNLAVSALRRVTVRSKTTDSGNSDSSDDSGSSDILAKMKEEGVWDLVCTVCREEVLEGEEVMELPCKHWFHSPCILSWFEAHCSCPLCRHLLPAAQVAETSGQGEGRLRRTHTSRRNARVRGLSDLLGEDAGGADPQGASQDAGDQGQDQDNRGGVGLLSGVVVPALRVACVVFAAFAVGRRLFGSARQSPLQSSSGQGSGGRLVQARATNLPGEGQRRTRDLALAMERRPLS